MWILVAAEKNEEKEGGPAAAAEKKEEKEGGPAAAAEKKEEKEGGPAAAAAKESTAPAKPKPPAKAPVKPLPEMMEEDVIPSLRSILEAQEDIKDLNLFFEDNKVSPFISLKILSNQHTKTKKLVYIKKLVVSGRPEPNRTKTKNNNELKTSLVIV